MEQKICGNCKDKKDIEEFQIRNKEKKTRNHWCRECLNEQKKIHYQKNKQAFLDKNKIRKKELNDFIDSFKTECKKCGYKKCKSSLDFHHLNPKEKEISIGSVANQGWSKNRIKKEIDKCIVLCKNCHAEIHVPIT